VQHQRQWQKAATKEKKSNFQQLDNYVSDWPAATTTKLLHIAIELFVGGD